MLDPKGTILQEYSFYNERGRSSKMTDRRQINILVLGSTGSGKSTFINLASGSKLVVSDSLASSTQTVEPGSDFELDGCNVTLYDAPGFNDTNKSDAETVEVIAAALETLYRQGILLHGILFFHRITDNRMSGSLRRSIGFLDAMCGDKALKNLVIVTNMWSPARHAIARADEEAREHQLKNDDRFFKPFLMRGASMIRHNNTRASTHDVIRTTLRNKPVPLRVQAELVDSGVTFSRTGVGRLVLSELQQLARRQAEEMAAIQQDMREERDARARRELQLEYERQAAALAEVQRRSSTLDYGFVSHRRHVARKLLKRRPGQSPRRHWWNCMKFS